MKINLCFAVFCLLACWMSIVAVAQEQKSEQKSEQQLERKHFVSDASHVVGTYKPTKVDHSPAAIEAAANAFLAGLSDAQKKSAMHALDSPERFEWTNLPAPTDAGGVRLGDLNAKQIGLACDLMANLFSQQGFDKVVHIMLADDQLLENGEPRRGFGTENFSIVIFGTPSKTEPWSFQVDGHHVGVNLALDGDKITMSPSFIGTQPQSFKLGDSSYRPFENETDLAHKLAMSLTDEQVKKAVLRPNRARLLTGPEEDGNVPTPKGVSCSTFSDEQKATLMSLISQWVNDLPEAQASKRMAEIKSEVDQMKFSWNGSREPGSDVSYMLQSPTLIIEYVCQDLGGDPLEHLHSMYRNPANEYGKQLKLKLKAK